MNQAALRNVLDIEVNFRRHELPDGDGGATSSASDMSISAADAEIGAGTAMSSMIAERW